jgi:hypothetical protein
LLISKINSDRFFLNLEEARAISLINYPLAIWGDNQWRKNPLKKQAFASFFVEAIHQLLLLFCLGKITRESR